MKITVEEGGGLKKTEEVRSRSDGNKRIVLYSSRNAEDREAISNVLVRREIQMFGEEQCSRRYKLGW